jgi:hypothetical protein
VLDPLHRGEKYVSTVRTSRSRFRDGACVLRGGVEDFRERAEEEWSAPRFCDRVGARRADACAQCAANRLGRRREVLAARHRRLEAKQTPALE